MGQVTGTGPVHGPDQDHGFLFSHPQHMLNLGQAAHSQVCPRSSPSECHEWHNLGLSAACVDGLA